MDREGALSSGSTLLNLACTDTPHYAFLKGCYYYVVGDSSSGKTFLAHTCFAEAVLNESFDKYRLIFDDVEGGALMDIERFFGRQVAKRIESPAIKKGKPASSDTIESFYHNIAEAIEDGRPFIYVLDSQDALGSMQSAKKFRQQRRAMEEGQDSKGSYGDGKAKFHSEHIREVLSGLRKRKSILIILGQTRDNLGRSFEPKSRSGGKALRFYANTEIWTSLAGKLKRRVRGTARTIGVRCLAEVKKNRVTGKIGKDRAITIPIYYDYGMDDVGSCVDFLIEEGHWRKAKKKKDGEDTNDETKKKLYEAPELLFSGSREQIVRYVEEEGMERKLRELAAKLWEEIEAECVSHRKKRYE